MKILAAVDQSTFSDRVVDMVLQIAHDDSSILLVNVVPREPDMLGKQLKRKVIEDPVPEALRGRRDLLDRLRERFAERSIACETLLIRGDPAKTLIREATRWGADLVVMGSHGRGNLVKRLVGSVSEGILRSRKLPVLVIPEPAS